MALITDLPAASSLATTDLLIKDTGSATQKLAVSNAYASASQPGLVSTGSQEITGYKNFVTGSIGLKSTGNYANVEMIANASSISGRMTLTADTNFNRILFSAYHRNNGVNDATYRDAYYLPRSGTDSASHDYDIITTGNINSIPNLKRISVKSGSSFSMTTGGYFGGVLAGFVQGVGGVVIGISCSGSSVWAKDLMNNATWSNSNLVISYSNNTLTISSPNASASSLVLAIAGNSV